MLFPVKPVRDRLQARYGDEQLLWTDGANVCARTTLARNRKEEELTHEIINACFRNPIDVRRSFVCAGGGYSEV